MTAFTIGLLSGGALVASLFNIDMATLQAMIGVAAGILLGLCVVYLYLLAQQPPVMRQPMMRETRHIHRRRIVTSVGYQFA